MNTVVVPLFARPEYFKIWIENLMTVDKADEQFYIFCMDWGYNQKHNEFIRNFPFDHGVVRTPKTNYKISKQSFNVLNGLLVGAKHSTELVYYIEEDVFIAKDYFTFMADVHAIEPDLFCSIGTKNNNSNYITTENTDYYYLSDRPDYQSLGSCFKKEVIINLIGPSFNDQYFSSPVAYCKKKFPDSIIGSFFVEQDGLIRRILEISGKKVAFPHVPRGFHGGIYGYNRRDNDISRLNFEQKVETIKRIAFNKEELKSYVKHPEYYTDSEPCELNTSHEEVKFAAVELIK